MIINRPYNKLIIIVNIQIADKTAPIIIKVNAKVSFPFLEYRIIPQTERNYTSNNYDPIKILNIIELVFIST